MVSAEMYLHIINNLSDGVYFVDKNRCISFWNKAAESITGYTKEEVVGRSCADNILNHIDEEGRPLCVVGCPLYASVIDGKQRKAEVFLKHKDGHRVPVLVNVFPMSVDGEIIGAAEIFTPNSPVVYNSDLVERLSNIAMHDELTSLPNRRHLQSFLEYKVNEYERFNERFAVLFLDIDNFRDFNNEYGHEAGDLVLKAVAKTISKTTRKADLFGRWGGEEFLGIYGVKSDYDAPIIAEKIRILVQHTQVPYDSVLSVTASVGVTIVQPGDTAESIVDRADKRMYASKEAGRNRVTAD